MDFQPNSEQKALQEGIRAFCAPHFSVEELGRLDECAVLHAVTDRLAEVDRGEHWNCSAPLHGNAEELQHEATLKSKLHIGSHSADAAWLKRA